MGRHSAWNEQDHPRDDSGRFGSGSGAPSTSGGSGTRNSGSRSNGRGMPSHIAGADVPVRGGKEVALDFHPGGDVTIATDKGNVRLPADALSDLVSGLKNAESGDDGEETWINKVGRDADGRPGSPTFAALIRTEGDNDVSLRLAPNSDPSADDMRGAPEVRLTGKDIAKIDQAVIRGRSATRIDSGYGDTDISISDDNKFVVRHLGDDGRPLDTKLNPKSFAKVLQAVDSVIDGWDEQDDTLADDDIVTERTISTNAGKVNVELVGPWRSSDPADHLIIAAEDGSWGIVIDGPRQQDFMDALSKVEDAGEALEIYKPEMKLR